MYDTNVDVAKLLDAGMKLEGLATTTSTHAAAVLITDKSGVAANTPMWENKVGIVTQYGKDLLEDLGLLKMDFLALITLQVISEAKKFIKINHGIDVDLNELYKCEDLKPLELIRNGNTVGIFQLESAGMSSFMKELKPENIEDIIAGIALYRPGPMDEIPRFLANKRNPSKIHYDVEGLDKILDETYGVIIYQEQCMRISTDIAGFSKGDSDNFRRIISKKKVKEMPKQREWFLNGRKKEDYDYAGHLRQYKNEIPGGLKLRHSEVGLNKVFDQMVKFAEYAFNKSHAASYALLAYVTAWLMYYYPTEMMAALLNSIQGKQSKVARYINYARKNLGIKIIEPDINLSKDYFVPTKNNEIIYTLNLKHCKGDTLMKITEEREMNGTYENMIDFFTRTRSFLDKATYEALVSANCFKGFGVVKSQFLAALDDFWEDAYKKTKEAEKRAEKSNRPFDFRDRLISKINGILPDIREYPEEVSLKMEKKYLGLYLTNHPLYKYSYSIKNVSNFKLSDLEYDIQEDTGMITMANSDVRDGQGVKFVAIVNSIDTLTTKKNNIMARIEVEDLTGIFSAIMWPRNFQKYSQILREDEIYLCYGTLQISDEAPTLIIEDIEPISETVLERAEINIETKEEASNLLKFIKNNKLARGRTPLYVKYNDIKILLNKNYWINVSFMKEHYDIKLLNY